MKNTNLQVKNYKKFGYCFYSNLEIKKKIINCKKKFLNNYIKLYKNSSRKKKLNIIKIFSGDPSISEVLHDKNLLDFLKKLKVDVPTQTSPIITHYTSKDNISKSFGLPFHQDYTSMASSLDSVIVWFNINNYSNKKIHGIKVAKYNKKKIIKGRLNKKKGVYEIPEKSLNKNLFEVVFPLYEVLVMSTFLPHSTYIDHGANKNFWRLGLSTRYDNLNCSFWNKNEYISAYKNIVDRKLIKKIQI